MIELGAEPLRQGGHPARPRRRASPTPHRVRDLTVAIALEGDFEAAHTDGDNALVVATDTMKNTAYAFAKDHLDGSIEALRPRRWPSTSSSRPQVDRATVNVREHALAARSTSPARPRPDAFVRGGEGTRVATVARRPRRRSSVEAGVEDLDRDEDDAARRSRGFPRDRYTTLPETDDRLMATKVTAIWRYGAPGPRLRRDVRRPSAATLLEVFADHDSPSVQTSIWIMARAMLERHEELDEVRMVLPEPPPLAGRPVAVRASTTTARSTSPTTEPHGLIEATVRRGEG